MTGSQQSQLTFALRNMRNLNRWERGFVRSLSQRPDTYRLTETQEQKLKAIYDKAAGL